MNFFGVQPSRAALLEERLLKLGIREEDLVERFVRSPGPGGQRVNKAATCVHLRHLPSGLEVKCSLSRSQGLNRYHARVILADRLEFLEKGRLSGKARERYLVRRRKQRRSRRTRLKVRRAKEIRSERKRLRAPVGNPGRDTEPGPD